MAVPSSMKLAGELTILTGAMHLVGFVAGGFSWGWIGLFPAGLVFIALGALVTRGYRLAGWLAWLGLGLGVSFLLVGLFTAPLPVWAWWLMLLSQGAALLVLLVALWRGPPVGDGL